MLTYLSRESLTRPLSGLDFEIINSQFTNEVCHIAYFVMKETTKLILEYKESI